MVNDNDIYPTWGRLYKGYNFVNVCYTQQRDINRCFSFQWLHRPDLHHHTQQRDINR